MSNLIFKDHTWTFEQLVAILKEIDTICREEMGLNPYPSQIEIVSAEQMAELSSTHGFANMYKHWSFGKRFLQEHKAYLSGRGGLAYETIIATNPSLAYCMEDNSSTIQALVIAHAAYGHSHVYRNNIYYGNGMDAAYIVPYLEFAKNYIRKCEETYGIGNVEILLDAAHALQYVSAAPLEKRAKTLKEEQERFAARQKAAEADYREIWTTVPENKKTPADAMPERQDWPVPESNLLYFLEKNSPALLPWERELLRIVRVLGQFWYPSMQISVVHESAAVYTHMYTMRRLYEKGFITEAAMLEVADINSGVIYQSNYENWRGWNIYTLGWAIAQDIERICTEPTDEDKKWFPDWAGNQDVMGTLRYAWENFRDESFIRQFLSPKVMRDLKMFRLEDAAEEDYYLVDAIHDDDGYRKIRSALADSYLPERFAPDIRVTKVSDDGTLCLTHYTDEGKPLETTSKRQVMEMITDLWGEAVRMNELTRDGQNSVKAPYLVE